MLNQALLRRSRSVPVLSSSWSGSAFVSARRFNREAGISRDKQRSEPGADAAGNQMGMCESPDYQPALHFSHNTLEQVRVPELSLEERYQSDVERDRRFRSKFGEKGPGDTPKKSITESHRDMLQAQQDIDGLPWEVRWRKSLIPTAEEVVQEIRDRFDLYILDPMEREMEWYLHWKDRSFRVQSDRLIWPQGFTDYLDHYDEHGRRRVLPTDQRWSNTSWKHLSDTNYRNRMWLLEGEERKANHKQLQSRDELLAAEEQRMLDQGNVHAAMQMGIIDISPDQAYQALSGTADPVEVAKTKLKIQAYGAKEFAEAHMVKGPEMRDAITGLPKSDLPPLPSGLTVEQGAYVAGKVAQEHDMMETKVEVAYVAGRSPIRALEEVHMTSSRAHDDQPALTSMAHQAIGAIKQKQALLDANAAQVGTAPESTRLAAAMGELEGSVLSATATPGGSSSSSNSGAGGVAAALSSPAAAPRPEGFLAYNPRPAGVELKVGRDLFDTPTDRSLDEVPEWYRTRAVDVGPMITTYGQVHDPIEEAPSAKPEYYTPPVITASTRISADRTGLSGASSFDDRKLQKERTMPELVNSFKPLPLYREAVEAKAGGEAADEAAPVSSTAATTAVPPSSASPATAPTAAKATKKKKTLKRSDELKKEREARGGMQRMDPDMNLPTLPWETSGLADPYRGVPKEDPVPYDKPALELTWQAYRGTLLQMMTEFSNLQATVTDEQSERMLLDTVQRFRNGEVGAHPPIDPEQEGVLRLIFEGHTRQFMSDLYKTRGGRTVESNVAKQEADDLLKRAAARCKLQGPSFMNFVQEMTALELDQVRKNPIQKSAVFIKDKKLLSLGKPYLRWIEKELLEFTAMRFTNGEHLETQVTLLNKTLNETKHRAPMRLDGVKDGERDLFITAIHCWSRGALSFYAGKKHMELYLMHAETRFRGRAETHFEDANELFTEYSKAAPGILSIPIPDADPMYDVEEQDFLDGENATYAEVQGQLEKAESIWHSGTNRRWYPMLDETEYMWFCERRGRIGNALDCSARCLESMNKKTHPSIHPFPERAYPFLEGAPLTQETAEHLWMRHMGDVYFEHCLMMARLGQFATAREHHQRSLNLYRIALRTAKERLPASWQAPLLTEAKLLMRGFDAQLMRPADHCAAIERVTAAMYDTSPRPAHWVHLYDNVPMRIALTAENQAAYGQLIQEALQAELKARRLVFTDQELLGVMELRARGQPVPAKFDLYFDLLSRSAEKHFRQVIAKWRAMEIEGSEAYYLWTYHYFTFKLKPASPAEVTRLWEMYEPAYLYIYTQAALGSRSRGYAYMSDALRRMSALLVEGSVEHKQTLLQELVKVREKLPHIIDRRELDRGISTLEAHLANPVSMPQPYLYGSQLILNQTNAGLAQRGNPLLRINSSAKDYAEMKQRLEDTRSGGMASTQPKMDDAEGVEVMVGPAKSAINTRNMFAADGQQ